MRWRNWVKITTSDQFKNWHPPVKPGEVARVYRDLKKWPGQQREPKLINKRGNAENLCP
jgi:hypothetical protein